jgi:hypothetical protein
MTYGGDLRLAARGEPLASGQTDLERLVAVERIRNIKALYCYCMDTKDWDGFEAVFTLDAVLDVPAHGPDAPARRLEGRSEIRRFVESHVGDVLTVHQCHTPVIEFESPDVARVAWAMEDMLRFPDGSPVRTLHGMGHYFERYRRDGDAWRIAHTRLARLRLELT